MKKLITTSLILAAGTLFSHAATPVVSGDSGLKVGGNCFAASYSISIWFDMTNLTGSTLLFAYGHQKDAGVSCHNFLKWDASDKTFSIGVGDYSSLSYTSGDGGTNRNVTSAAVSDDVLSGWHNITLAVTLNTAAAKGNNQEVAFYFDGTSLGYQHGSPIAYKGNYNGGNSPSTGTSIPNLIWNNNVSYGNVNLKNEVVSSDGIAAFMGSVPEPSAFGLIAGLGALALVASRRRRSRK